MFGTCLFSAATLAKPPGDVRLLGLTLAFGLRALLLVAVEETVFEWVSLAFAGIARLFGCSSAFPIFFYPLPRRLPFAWAVSRSQ